MEAKAPSQPGTCPTLARLEREWRHVCRSTEAAAGLRAWSARHPALARYNNVSELVATVSWEGYGPRPPGDQVLSSLLTVAKDALAARALLQCLVPRLAIQRVALPRFGHGLDEYRQSTDDTLADLVAECFMVIRRHAGEDHFDVARLVLGEAVRRMRTARQAQRRYTRRVVPWPGAGDQAHSRERTSGCVDDTFGPAGAWTPAEHLAHLLCATVREGRIDQQAARLIYAARVQGLPACRAARVAGLEPQAAYYALGRAEAALMRAAA